MKRATRRSTEEKLGSPDPRRHEGCGERGAFSAEKRPSIPRGLYSWALRALPVMLALMIFLPLLQTACAETADGVAFGREFSAEYAAYGDYVTLRYTVRNALDEVITAVTVSDPLVGVAGYAETLAPGERRVFTARVRVTADCLSTPALSYALNGRTLTVAVPQKGVTLENTALSAVLAEEAAEDGHTLVLTVTNQGNAPVYGVKAADRALGDMGAAVSALNPGESARFERILTSAGSHLCHIAARSAGGQALEIDSNALDTQNAHTGAQNDAGGVTLSAALEGGRVLVTVDNATDMLYENLALTERTGGETRTLRFLPARGRMQLVWAAGGETGETLAFDLALPDGQSVSSEPLTLDSAPEAEDNPLDAIPDGVSFRMADNPQTYRDMMLGAELTLIALGAGAWFAAAIRRRRERRRRIKKRQERKKQRLNTVRKAGENSARKQ